MTIPLTVNLYEKGANGVPQTTGRAENFRGRIDGYEQTIAEGYGFEGMRFSFAATRHEANEWDRADHLMRAVEVFGPRGSRVWEGALVEITITRGDHVTRLSLKDTANRLIVRYNTSQGDHGASAIYENA